MQSALEKLQHKLETAQRALAEAEARCALYDTEHQETTKDLEKIHNQANQEWIAALDVVEDPIFLHDNEFRILRCNKAYQRCAGISFREIIGQPYFAVFPKNAGPLQSCLSSMKNATEVAEEVMLGSGKIFRSRASPIYDAKGKYLNAIHVMEDISERKQAEQALQESETKFRSLFQSMTEGVALHELVCDTEGRAVDYRILEINPAFERHTGVHAAVKGKLASQIYDISPAPYLEVYEKVVRTGETVTFETYFPPLQRHFEISAFTPKQGQFATVFMDITKRKRTEAALLEKERLVSESQRIAHVGGWDYKLTGLLSWTDEMYRIFGVSPDTFSPTVESLLHLIHPDDRLAMQAWIEACQAGEKPGELEFRVILSDGAVRIIRGRGELKYDAENRPIYLAGTAQDVTDLKLAEKNQQRLNRALSLLTKCNTALIHAKDEQEILSNICKLAVDAGGYMMAWVGFAEDDDAKTVRPVAQSGYEEGYLDGINITWADTERGRGPTGTAIRMAQSVVNQNILTNPSAVPWVEAAIKRGYHSSIALPLVSNKKVLGALSIYAAEPNAFVAEEVTLLEELANDLAYGIITLRTRTAHEQHAEILRKSLEQSIQTIADTVEARDPYTAGHQRRVAELATAIAREIGLPEEQITGIHLAAIIHDLGKIHIPAEILSKPGKLDDIEFMLIKTHPQYGRDILKNVKFPWPIADIVWQHHEKLDGSGYPKGLKGGQILLESRIMTVADVVEAMSSHRPYRAALGIEAALNEIKRGRDSAYDPAVVDACLNLFAERGFTFSSQ